MKKLYKYCKEDLVELSALLVGDPDNGHGAFTSISAECTGIMTDIETGKQYCVRTVFINGKITHFTETLYQQLFAHDAIATKGSD